MRTPETEKMLEPSAFTWAITWRWLVSAPWGETQLELTCDAPELQGDPLSSARLGVLLWMRSVAAATTADTWLIGTDVVCWNDLPGAVPYVHPPQRGLLAGTAASRENTPQLVQHTGHLDRRSLRRMPIPGVPSTWVEDGLVTVGGRQALEGLGQLMVMGLCGHLVPGPMVWLVPYPGALDTHLANPTGVGFRRMEYLRVAWHVREAPERYTGPWP